MWLTNHKIIDLALLLCLVDVAMGQMSPKIFVQSIMNDEISLPFKVRIETFVSGKQLQF